MFPWHFFQYTYETTNVYEMWLLVNRLIRTVWNERHNK